MTIIRKSTTALTDLIVNGDTVDITDGYSSTVVNTDAVNNLPFDLTAKRSRCGYKSKRQKSYGWQHNRTYQYRQRKVHDKSNS